MRSANSRAHGTGSQRRPLWPAFMLLPLVLLAAAGWWAWVVASRQAEAQLQRGVDVLHEHARSVLQAGELLLTALDERVRGMSWPEIAASREVHDVMVRLRADLPMASGVRLVTPDGRLAAVDWEFPTHQEDASDREYFRAAARGGGGTFIGEVIEARARRDVVFTMSRVRQGPDGPSGLLVASFDSGAFARFYAEALGDLPGIAALMRADGTILARYPVAPLPFRVAPDHPFMEAVARGQVSSYGGLASRSGVPRRYIQRQVGNYPVYVLVALDDAAVTSAWLRQVWPFGALTLAVTGLAGLLARRAGRHAGALAAAEAVAASALTREQGTRRLRGVFESIVDGVIVFDHDWHITYVNDRMRELVELGPTPDLLGRVLWEVVPRLRDTAIGATYRIAMESGQMARVEGAPHAVGRWFDVTAMPFSDGLTVFLRDVSGRHAAEVEREALVVALEAKRAGQQLLINELNHRVKNTLATVQSIAAQTLRDAAGPAAARAALTARLRALAAAHDVLTRESWEGADLAEVAAAAVAPFQSAAGDRLALTGTSLRVPPRMALALAMALHELATNATKYGALSSPEGHVAVTWTGEDGSVALRWTERGGLPISAPTRRGFGLRLIERGLMHELGGKVSLDWALEGLTYEIVAPLRASPAWKLPSAA